MIALCFIEPCDSTKYLGVVIDSDLRFSTQANITASKCKQRLYIVKHFIFLVAEERLVTQIFRTFVESHMLYFILVVFHNLYDKDKQALRQIYKIADRMGAIDIGTLDTRD